MQSQLKNSWKPNLKDTGINPGTGELVREMIITLKAFNCKKLIDENGIFALDLERGIFTARRYIWGNLVSTHLRAIVSAINQSKPLIMYIQSVNKFYEFNPKELLEEGEENKKGNARFLNFKISKGKQYMT